LGKNKEGGAVGNQLANAGRQLIKFDDFKYNPALTFFFLLSKANRFN